MILDMHVHTVASDDSTATIPGYIDLILAYRQFHPFDGFVLTEHRAYTPGLDLRRYRNTSGKTMLFHNGFCLTGVHDFPKRSAPTGRRAGSIGHFR